MREIRLSGSEGGGTGYSTGPPYPYQQICLDEALRLVALGSAHSKHRLVLAARRT
jgi:hypothetical protein